jgi:uncharacterized protein YgfB (UPF0149 family)
MLTCMSTQGNLTRPIAKLLGLLGMPMKGQLQLHGMIAGQLEMGADEMAWYGMAYEGLQSYCTWHIAVV